MPRPCSICGHPRRAEIDADLAAGASLDDVLGRFGLPSRSALQRHRASHLGREVTFHLPPTNVTAAAASAPTPGSSVPVDPAAMLAHLFARATEGAGPSLQDYARLTIDGLAHTYAASVAAGDHGIAVRSLRELRALLQFYALVPVDRLKAHADWREPPQARDPIHDLERLLLADFAGADGEVADALAALDARHPGFASAWPANAPSRGSGTSPCR